MSGKVYDVEIIYRKSSFPKEKDIISRVTQLLDEVFQITASKFKVGESVQKVGTQLFFEIHVNNSNKTDQQLLSDLLDVFSKNQLLSAKKKVEIKQQQQQFEEKKDVENSHQEEEQKKVESDKQKFNKNNNKIARKDSAEIIKEIQELNEYKNNMNAIYCNTKQPNQSTKPDDNRNQLSPKEIKNINDDGLPHFNVRQNQKSFEQSSLLNRDTGEQVNEQSSKTEGSKKEVKKYNSSEKIKKKS